MQLWHDGQVVLEFMTDDTTSLAPRLPRSHSARKRQRQEPPPSAAEKALTHALLQQLAAWYPYLFGPKLLPLKRGIFHDLLEAHGAVLNVEILKQALARHTRSTRYLSAIAAGQARHNLQNQAVEDVAPEHVYWAVHEVFRRRQRHTTENLSAQLRSRIVQAFQHSGLSQDAYRNLVHSRHNVHINAQLEQALAQAAAQDAKAEALLRAYEASGNPDIASFAAMYGLDPRTTAGQLQRARQLQNLVQTTEQDAKAEALLHAYEASGSPGIIPFAEMYGLDPHITARQLQRARQLQHALPTPTSALA